MSSVNVRCSEKPSVLSVFVHVFTFLCGAFLPRICISTGRCLGIVSLAPISISALAIRIRQGFASPLALYVSMFVLVLLSVGTLAFLALVIRTTRSHLVNRTEANPSAIEIVQRGLKTKRIIREKLYDVYLPPWQHPTSKKHYPVAFFMLPGALVEHNAYADVLSQLADAGILVLVQNCEPVRVASETHSSSESAIREMIKHTQQHHGISAEKWSIGGHSMGGYTAMMIAKKSDFFASLVLYAVNKNYEMEKTAVRVLAITASNDGLQYSPMADLSTFNGWGEGETRGRLFHVVIEGGNHSGFADYPRQTFPLPDGDRSISLQEQHRQVVEATVKFLIPKQE